MASVRRPAEARIGRGDVEVAVHSRRPISGLFLPTGRHATVRYRTASQRTGTHLFALGVWGWKRLLHHLLIKRVRGDLTWGLLNEYEEILPADC